MKNETLQNVQFSTLLSQRNHFPVSLRSSTFPNRVQFFHTGRLVSGPGATHQAPRFPNSTVRPGGGRRGAANFPSRDDANLRAFPRITGKRSVFTWRRRRRRNGPPRNRPPWRRRRPPRLCCTDATDATDTDTEAEADADVRRGFGADRSRRSTTTASRGDTKITQANLLGGLGPREPRWGTRAGPGPGRRNGPASVAGREREREREKGGVEQFRGVRKSEILRKTLDYVLLINMGAKYLPFKL